MSAQEIGCIILDAGLAIGLVFLCIGACVMIAGYTANKYIELRMKVGRYEEEQDG